MAKFKKQLNIIFSGISGSIGKDNPQETFSKELHKFNAVSDKVDFGILYNALMEKGLGGDIGERQCFKDIVVMGDSGGFQVITGKVPNGDIEVLKKEVYKHQAKNADYGFCFDVEPTNNGFYDHNLALKKTLETNGNIKKQIEVFKETKTECRIFPIAKVQPEDRAISYENLLKYCDISMIAGMGANTRIFGELFAYPFFYREFQQKAGFPNVLHHLGAGTPSTILPFYLLAKEGFFGEDFVYSVDATSYSHSLILRSTICRLDGKIAKMADLTEGEFEEWKNYCLQNMPELCVEKAAFHNLNRHQTLSVKGGLFKVFIISSLSYAMKMFLNMVEDPWKFAADNEILTYHQLQSIKELAKCRDWNDYYAWKGVFSGVWEKVNPRKVKPLERSSLDAFF